jgi:hypothetical protein
MYVPAGGCKPDGNKSLSIRTVTIPARARRKPVGSISTWRVWTALATLASVVLVGCGGVGSEPRPSQGSRVSIDGALSVGVGRTLRGLRGDEDDDDQESRTWEKVATFDADIDRDDDARDNRGKEYYDGDDGQVRDFGRLATPVVRRALEVVARDYLRAGAAMEGQLACSLMSANMVAAAAQYGQVGGPSYLRGASGCGQVMTRLFSRDRAEFAGGVKAVAARVDGAHAYLLIGSRTRVARYLSLGRVRAAWKLESLLPSPLP